MVTSDDLMPSPARLPAHSPRLFGRAYLLVMLLIAIIAPALAIEPFTADYQASYQGKRGSGRMTLVAAGTNRWTYSLTVTSALGNLRQSTVFEDRNGQWRPLSASDSFRVLTKRRNKDAVYDWTRGVANWTGDVNPDRAGPIKLQTGDMDALLINLAIVRDLAAGKPLTYRMVEDGRVKQLSYSITGKEQISIAGKPRTATKVESIQGDKQTFAWVVDGLPVPARILQRDKGRDVIDLHVRSVR